MSPYAPENNQDPGGGLVTEGSQPQQNIVNTNKSPTTTPPPQNGNVVISTPPATAINAAGVNNGLINGVLNNSSSSSSSSSSPSPASISPPLSDIEQTLNAYPTDLPELVVAACWWAESLGKLNMNIPKENIKRFRKELIFALRDRIKGHWYPDYPERGQGYRAIICEETTDRLLMDAAKKSDIVGEFRQLVKQNTTMWIDPGNVTYRHGKHYEKTLYPFNSINNNNSNGNINISNSNNTIPINTSGYHNTNLNNSNNTIPPQQSQQHINNNSTNNILLNSLHHQQHQNQISQQHLNNNNNNQNNFSYGITSTRLTPNVVNSNSNGLNGRVSSPSLSSTAPVFSPSNSMYHHIQQSHSPSISPPASPSKDLGNSGSNNTNVYSSNNNLFYNSNTSSSKIKLAYS
ncbi:hypothetical protein ACTFIV_004152 [Dictyostelium citrinum]